MKYNKKDLLLENGITKEWIITNGIGGYSSSTIIGANTRKYHGLLVAPLMPPASRHLILSKIDESIEINEKKYNLYTNMCKNYISEGYKYLEEFEKDYIPIFTYKVENIIIKKLICMEYRKNTVCILYKIKNQNTKTKLNLAPILNFRDFHQMNTDHNYKINQEINKNKVKLVIDDNSTFPIYIYSSEGKYIEHKNDIFKNMYYIEEEKRGFFPEEDLIVSGKYEIELEPNEEKEISIICSLEENIEQISAKQVISDEIARINGLIFDSELIKNKDLEKIKNHREFIKDYIVAADNFIVYRPNFGLHTIIAGYYWFLDWGRDSLISFEGLLLKTKRYDIAREVLLTTIRDIKFGLVPNGYSGYDNRPLYNSVDSSLLLFEQVHKYLKYTSDFKFIKDNIYEKLIEIIDAYIKGIDVDNNNIYLDTDNLIVSGTEETQNTWMDAKYGDFAATPRNGKAVEINSMWYNSLKILEELTIIFKDSKKAKKYTDLANKCQKSFKEKFYNSKKKCLYDVLGDAKIRPNQLFSIGLTYKVLEPSSIEAKTMFETVTKKLLNNYGLKTLAKGEKNYIEVYEGDGFKRDMSYHQGITWPWLLGIYNDSFKAILQATKNKKEKIELQEKYNKFIENITKTFEKSIYEDGCVGSISEIYDSNSTHLPKGAVAQAWSVAEVYRILLEK